MNVLVTGGAGFIGSNLVRRLVERGHRVRVLDNLETGKRRNLAEVSEDLELLVGDIRNEQDCLDGCRATEAVLHLAALGSVPRSIRDPWTTHEVNVGGTLNLLLAARECGVRRFVLASSSSVYGNRRESVMDESFSSRPLSPYAASKLAAEAYSLVFGRTYGLETVVLRYFNVFGPRQDPNSMYAAVVPRFVTSLLAGEAPVIYGDGGQSRDFTYVENVVSANLLALACEQAACAKVYNVACGETVSVNELFKEIRKVLSGCCEDHRAEGISRGIAAVDRIEPVYEPPRQGDVLHSRACIDAARRGLGYAPKVEFEEGVRRTVDWFRSVWERSEQNLRLVPRGI